MRPGLLLAFALALAGCDDAEQRFVEGRLRDACTGNWPVCTTFGGCVMTPTSYVEGRFPGTRRFLVRTSEPTHVDVVLFFRTQAAQGEETRFAFDEAGCGSRTTVSVDGKSFFKESIELGEFRRGADLFKPGDHLVELTSDATADYVLKLELSAPKAEQ